jgi:small-conductance mechanosensitive channel
VRVAAIWRRAEPIDTRRPTAFRNYAATLRVQTMHAAGRARRELLLIVPLIAGVIAAYLLRDELFGADEPVRYATAVVLAIAGTIFARDLGRALEPHLVRHLEPGAVGVVGFLIRLATLATILFTSLRIAGLEIGTLVVGASFTAVVVGLAAQHTLGNVLSGLFLLSARPFQVGDRVRFNGFGMDVEGTVAAHGLLYLTLTDGDDTVLVPNNTALTMSVRPIREPASVDMRARLPYGVDPAAIEERITGEVTVPTKDSPHVSLEEFDGEEIVVRIKATPSHSREGGKLASEVLKAIAALRESAAASRDGDGGDPDRISVH